ncbi:MAG: S9 family peptidase [Holophagales bacterium]|jgi:dipeptidyl aminopeptidase/acylaminoacyl peptidase|nr:S9 family peptidase [Holophagales bacterium]
MNSLLRFFCSQALPLVLLSVSPALLAQGTKADYERWAGIQELTRNKVYRGQVVPVWNKSGTAFMYRNGLHGGKSEWIRVENEKKSPALDESKFVQAMGKALGAEVDLVKSPIENLNFGEGTELTFRLDGKNWKLADPSAGEYSISAATAGQERQGPGRGGWYAGTGAQDERRPVQSPDGKLEAIVQDDNVLIREVKGGAKVLASKDGNMGDRYFGQFFWSPDSKYLVALRSTVVPQRKVTFVEAAPRDQLQPKVHSNDYTKPGDPLPIQRPQLFNVAEKRQVPVSDELCPNPYAITRIQWASDSSRFTYIFNQRGHQLLRLISVDASTGASKVLVEETSKTFIHYSAKTWVDFLDEQNELVWMSERTGWNHIYLMDSKTGAVKNPITKGDWVVRSVVNLDKKNRTAILSVSGIKPNEDPYFIHYAIVNLDGSGFRLLTEGNGTHRATFNEGHTHFVDVWSRVDSPPVAELRRVSDGKVALELEKADISDWRKTGIRMLEPFKAKGRNGKTDIYGVVCLPSNFNPKKKYPVIEYIYAGPHDSFVPKAFSPLQYHLHAMAELGFIVVQIDGMGTDNRGKAFHDVCWQNLGDSGFPDRILWMKEAQKKYPQMDLERVGIFGGSAGGQSSTRALLAFGDFYKVGVSDCGCHDNRMDKIWWNEQWMGWPIGPHYEEQSNVTQAHNLKGKLMLIVGEVDTNVDPASTMQVADALIKADKDFELIVMTSANHGSAESPYGRRRRADFFVRHLHGVEPRR